MDQIYCTTSPPEIQRAMYPIRQNNVVFFPCIMIIIKCYKQRQVHIIKTQLYFNILADEYTTITNATKTQSSPPPRCRAAGRKNINARSQFYSLYLFIRAHIYRTEIVIIARLDQLSAYIMIAVCIVADTLTHTCTHTRTFTFPQYLRCIDTQH